MSRPEYPQAELAACPTCGPLQGWHGPDVGTVNMDCPTHGEPIPAWELLCAFCGANVT